MPMQQLLFSFQGRIGRQTYWMWNLAYYAIIIAVASLSNVLFPHSAHLLLPLFLLLMLFPDLAVTAKRWHDRGKSTWWLVLNIPLIVGRMMMPSGQPDMMASPSSIQMVSSLVAIACGSWILIECGFLRGQAGENAYGPEPQ
ncbi:DUF805 domain-containing protein [Vibrio sp.]|uniref:DUF805 domain-containing protein n=1 Tax=Vibrio sp. TaxID=678 RepID=UPI003D100C0E